MENRQDAEKVRQRRSRLAQRLNVPNVRLAASLAAALLDSLFEDPESIWCWHHTENFSHIVGISQVLCSLLV
jgi:hypothetical protein